MKQTIAYFLGLLITLPLVAQETFQVPPELKLTKKDSTITSSWLVGLGLNVVDDAGSEFSDAFNVEENWNFIPYPSRFSIGKYFKTGLGIELIAAYNQYQEGKRVDGNIITEDLNYVSGDVRFSYDLNHIIGQTGFFDPYVGVGLGYTDANRQGRGTYNAVLGFRTWLNDKWGLDFNSTGKWTMDATTTTNHLQHAAGVVYRFDHEKGLTSKGQEKLRLRQELEAANKQKQDSIAAVKAEEERLALAARLEQERLEQEAKAKLAAAQKAKDDAIAAKKQSIKDAINDLGYVYFELNSSYLPKSGKELLEKLTQILQENPSVVIEVTSHTDSRGQRKYNQWLSERRVNRTRDYLISKGIADNRIKAQAFGEDQLANACADRVPCSEEKHSQNRRSTFKVVSF